MFSGLSFSMNMIFFLPAVDPKFQSDRIFSNLLYSIITQEEADQIERQNLRRDSSPNLDSFNQFDWSSDESDVSDEYDDTNERKGISSF